MHYFFILKLFANESWHEVERVPCGWRLSYVSTCLHTREINPFITGFIGAMFIFPLISELFRSCFIVVWELSLRLCRAAALRDRNSHRRKNKYKYIYRQFLRTSWTISCTLLQSRRLISFNQPLHKKYALTKYDIDQTLQIIANWISEYATGIIFLLFIQTSPSGLMTPKATN